MGERSNLIDYQGLEDLLLVAMLLDQVFLPTAWRVAATEECMPLESHTKSGSQEQCSRAKACSDPRETGLRIRDTPSP